MCNVTISTESAVFLMNSNGKSSTGNHKGEKNPPHLLPEGNTDPRISCVKFYFSFYG